MKIYKYPFEVTGLVKIAMPANAQILTVQTQHETPCIWAIVDTEHTMETRTFHVFGTGHSLDIDLLRSKYIGTFQLLNGQFVGHLFEV